MLRQPESNTQSIKGWVKEILIRKKRTSTDLQVCCLETIIKTHLQLERRNTQLHRTIYIPQTRMIKQNSAPKKRKELNDQRRIQTTKEKRNCSIWWTINVTFKPPLTDLILSVDTCKRNVNNRKNTPHASKWLKRVEHIKN